MMDYIIVLIEKSEKERMVNFCEKKNLPLFEYCQNAILEKLNNEPLENEKSI
jgi:hypothetical protein